MMNLKSLVLLSLILFPASLFSQDTKADSDGNNRMNTISLGVGMNIPFKPNSEDYGMGMSVGQRYEFLLWSHWSLVESCSYNFISGKDVNKYYYGEYVDVSYKNFSTVPLQFGVGYYFGADQTAFFVLLKGGIAWYWGENPAFPEINVNGNVVREAVPAESFSGTYSFFTPTVGWQFKKAAISASYQGHVEQDASLNILNVSFFYRIY
jgi:hypothetical protein